VIDEADSLRLENIEVAGDAVELPILDPVDDEFRRGIFHVPGASNELSDEFADDTEFLTTDLMFSSRYAAGRQSTVGGGSVGVRRRGISRRSIVSLAISSATLEQISRS
jgi:hypothetical protein